MSRVRRACVATVLVVVLSGCSALTPGPPGARDGTSATSGAAATGGFGPAPGELRTARVLPGRVVATLGVVSFNAYRHLPRARARADWQRLTARDDVDLVGWQEAKSPAFRALAPRYRARGFETWRWPDPDGPISLAFSWRPAVLTLLDVDVEKVHRGGYPRETDDPFPARWVVTAQFRHRGTGLAVTLLNTHVNQGIETGDGFADNLNARFARRHLARLAALWPTAPGDVVVGTGDYNFDHVDDRDARPVGGIARRFAGRATSSYDALGLEGLLPTRRTRWIDYVWLADRTLRRRAGGRWTGTAQFARHRVLSGYASDHRPVLARVRLYAD
ncbi:hypothetical protein [Nocardioides perillae]|uniref:Endonuclease/exonuclease/phosphatase family metal-dependent hydrolase n=1 Tax=Nocardioides perillae TaxID=1119534 RepID=A0A7Y9RP03_9ACTN|nr:hypothetical protein [Nocardioides perillae]NYG53886.1 endonuclease/exonuclease/phosphatase family metal-dependent hydrolase [Nocardioides perillae]